MSIEYVSSASTQPSFHNPPPGFSTDELGHTNSGIRYHLFLRPHGLFYWYLTLSIVQTISVGLETGEPFFFMIIPLVYIATYWFVFYTSTKFRVLTSVWHEKTNEALKYWFREVPQRIHLHQESRNLWFKGKRFNPRIDRQPLYYMESRSTQESIYYECILRFDKKIQSTYFGRVHLKLIFFAPIIVGYVILLVTILSDFITLDNCLLSESYSNISNSVVLSCFSWALTSAVYMLWLEAIQGYTKIYYLKKTNSLNTLHPIFVYQLNDSDSTYHKSLRREKSNSPNVGTPISMRILKYIYMFIFSTLLVLIIAVANISSVVCP